MRYIFCVLLIFLIGVHVGIVISDLFDIIFDDDDNDDDDNDDDFL